jgi:DNA-binding NarL/FixJ family response regulator
MGYQAREAPLRILVVDDHAIVREGLRRILEDPFIGWNIAEAADGAEALASMRRQPADVAIIDLSMAGMGGLELIACLRNEFSKLAILVLSMHEGEHHAVLAFRAGANGYLTKDSASADLLVGALRRVAEGGAFVSPGLAEKMLQQRGSATSTPGQAADLSPRERQVLGRITDGERLTDIAEALGLSIQTVSTHKIRILEKLRLPSTAALIRYGLALDPAEPTWGISAVDKPPPPRKSPDSAT